MWLQLDPRAAAGGEQTLVDATLATGQGWRVAATPQGTVEITLNDGRTESRWDCDPGVIETGKLHHVAVIVDGGPSIITFVVDGKLADGGDHRQFGWAASTQT